MLATDASLPSVFVYHQLISLLIRLQSDAKKVASRKNLGKKSVSILNFC